MRPDIRHGKLSTPTRSNTASPLALPDFLLPPPTSVQLDYTSPYICQLDLNTLRNSGETTPPFKEGCSFKHRQKSSYRFSNPNFLDTYQIACTCTHTHPSAHGCSAAPSLEPLDVMMGGGGDQSHLTKVCVGVDDITPLDEEQPDDLITQVPARKTCLGREASIGFGCDDWLITFPLYLGCIHQVKCCI